MSFNYCDYVNGFYNLSVLIDIYGYYIGINTVYYCKKKKKIRKGCVCT